MSEKAAESTPSGRPGRVLTGIVAALLLFSGGVAVGQVTARDPEPPIPSITWNQPGTTYEPVTYRPDLVTSAFSRTPVGFRQTWLTEAAYRAMHCLSGQRSAEQCASPGALGYPSAEVVPERELRTQPRGQRPERRVAIDAMPGGVVRVLVAGELNSAYGFEMQSGGFAAICVGPDCDRDRSARAFIVLSDEGILDPAPEVIAIN